jgi:DNA-binding response OmpR family regulator
MRHLLIIEDSTLITSALRLLFETQGYRVTVAHAVATGVACATADPADVMLLDLTLPDGHGLDVLRLLHDNQVAPGATIALTGTDDPAIRTRCLTAGCQAVLVKPVPIQELLAAVQSL